MSTVFTLAYELNSQHWIHSHAGYLVSICAQQGDLARAEAILATTFTDDIPMPTMGQRLLWCASVEVLLARQQAEQALRCIERLLALTPAYDATHHVPWLSLLHGKALLANGQSEAAIAELEHGCAAALELDALALLWQLQTQLARCHHQMRQPEHALTAADAARATIHHLAAEIADAAVRANFLRHAEAMLPVARALTTNRALKHQCDGLTQRERAVARLIAHGCSNREIAAQLIVSERTVETDVSNILSKLNFTARTQIATWAVAKGLMDNEAI